MLRKPDQVKLQDGTQVRHKVLGYEGLIEGTTGIKACFTDNGALLNKLASKQTFQYRVAVKGESTRRIAPDDDLEILELVEITELDSEALAEVRANALELEKHAYELSKDVYGQTSPLTVLGE